MKKTLIVLHIVLPLVLIGQNYKIMSIPKFKYQNILLSANTGFENDSGLSGTYNFFSQDSNSTFSINPSVVLTSDPDFEETNFYLSYFWGKYLLDSKKFFIFTQGNFRINKTKSLTNHLSELNSYGVGYGRKKSFKPISQALAIEKVIGKDLDDLQISNIAEAINNKPYYLNEEYDSERFNYLNNILNDSKLANKVKFVMNNSLIKNSDRYVGHFLKLNYQFQSENTNSVQIEHGYEKVINRNKQASLSTIYEQDLANDEYSYLTNVISGKYYHSYFAISGAEFQINRILINSKESSKILNGHFYIESAITPNNIGKISLFLSKIGQEDLKRSLNISLTYFLWY